MPMKTCNTLKCIFTTLCILGSCFSFSQKKDYYYNEFGAEITKKEYKKRGRSRTDFLFLSYDIDTAYVNIIEKRKVIGRVHPDTLATIKRNIEVSIGEALPPHSYLIINYYPGMDRCNASGSKSFVLSKYKSFAKRIGKDENTLQFFVYKDKKGLDILYDELTWIPDENNTLQNNFFVNHYPCGSFVVIKEDGLFILYKGEYATSQIFEHLKELKSK